MYEYKLVHVVRKDMDGLAAGITSQLDHMAPMRFEHYFTNIEQGHDGISALLYFRREQSLPQKAVKG